MSSSDDNNSNVMNRVQDAAANMRKAISEFQLEVNKLTELGHDIERLSDRIQRRGTFLPEASVTHLPTASIPRSLEGGPIYRGDGKIKGE